MFDRTKVEYLTELSKLKLCNGDFEKITEDLCESVGIAHKVFENDGEKFVSYDISTEALREDEVSIPSKKEKKLSGNENKDNFFVTNRVV